MGIFDEVELVEHHLHNKERWFGKIAGNNETNAIENNLTPFRITSGVGAYGTQICVVGSSDVSIAGKNYFDLHRIMISLFQKAEVGKLRIAWGTGTHANAITNEAFSTVMVNTSNTSKESIDDIMMVPVANGTKVWVSFWSTTNTQYVDIFIGLHGYVL